MRNPDKVGFGAPPMQTRWKKGQSGNPKGRPKTKSEIIVDAARILNQPVKARAPDGKTVRLDGIEAGFLSLCKKGLNGHKTSLLDAIRIMLEVGPALESKEVSEEASKREFLDTLERLGVKVRH